MIIGISYIHWLVVISAIISIIGSSAYIRDTIKGTTRPNRVSWGMWALAPLIGTAAALYAGADIWASVRIFLAGFLPLLVFIASFYNKQSYWRLTKFDLACGISSILALIIWGITNSPQIAILLAATGDAFASIPTIRKAWKYPETETGTTYMASLLAVILILPSIPRWNIENSAFQIYLLIVNLSILFAIYRKNIFPQPIKV